MSEEIGRGVVKVEGDASGFVAEMAKAESASSKFERSSVTSAGNAAKALAGVGKSAAGGLNELDSASKRFAASIERETARLSLSRAEYRRWEAERKGVSAAVYGPLVKQLEEATRAQQGFGKTTADVLRGMDAANIRTTLSAKQLSAAYRLLPAQITDIVTGLVSGQPAYLVAIQQGGQLKDSFGGIANAGRALLGIFTPMRLAIGGLAAALGTIAFAAYQSSEETTKLVRSLALTGNAAGLTADRFREYSAAIAENTKTGIGAARETLLSLAATGRLSGEALTATAEAVQRLAVATGDSTDDIAKKLLTLLDSGARGAANLNKQYNFLTVEQFKNIQALYEQGRAQEAVAATMTALNERIGDQTVNLGFWSRRLQGARADLSALWNVLKEVLGTATRGDKLVDVSRNIADVEARIADAIVQGNDRIARSLEPVLARLRERRALISSDALLEIKKADLAAETAIKTQSAIEKLLQPNKSGRAGPDAAAGLIREINRIIEVNEARLAAGGELTKAQELELQLNEKLKESLKELTRAKREEIEAAIKRAVVSQEALQVQADELRSAQALAALRAETRRRLDDDQGVEAYLARQKAASEAALHSAEDHLRSLRDEEKAIALVARTTLTLAEAVTTVTIARLEEERNKYIADSDEYNRLTKIIALRREELEIITKRADSAAEIAASKALGEANAKAAADVIREWEKASDELNRSLTDALFRAAESGEDAFVSLRRTIVGLFSNLVLRPVIQAGVSGFVQSVGLGAAGQAVGSAVSQGFAANGLIGGFTGGTSGLATAFATSSVGQTLGLSAQAVTAAQAAELGISATTASLTSAGSALAAAAPYIAVAAALFSAFRHKVTPHIGAVATADRIGSRVVDSSVLNFPTPETSTAAQNVVVSLSSEIQRSLQGLADAFEGGTIRVTTAFADDSSSDGAWGSFRLAVGELTAVDWSALADNDKWPGRGFADGATGFTEFTTAIGQDIIRAISESISDSSAFGREIERALGALPQSAGLEQITAVVDYFVGLKPAFDQLERVLGSFGLELDSITETAIDAAGGIGKLAETVATYYDLTRTDAEKLADSTVLTTEAFRALGFELPASMQAYRDLVDELSATASDGAAQELVFDLMELAPAMRSLSDALDELSKSAERTTLETQRTVLQGQIDALEALAGDFSVLKEPVLSLSEAFSDAVDELKGLEDGLDALLGNVGRTIQETLSDMIDSQRALQSVRVSLADAIEEAALRGLSPEDRVIALRSRETGLFAQLQTAADPVAVAGRLQAVVLARIKEEAGIRQAFDQSAIDALREQEQLARNLRDDQIDALREQIRGAERLKRLGEDIAQFTGSLRFGDLSPLNPGAQLNAAASLFATTLSGAQAGDENARNNLIGNSRAYLEEAQQFFASSAAYAGIFSQVTAALDAMGLDAVNADPQIAALEAQIAALEALNAKQSELVDAVIETSADEVAGLTAIDNALALREDANATRIDTQIQLARDQITELQGAKEELGRQLLAAQEDHEELMEQMRAINKRLESLDNHAAIAEGAPA